MILALLLLVLPAQAQPLKKVNYQDATAESQSPVSEAPALSPEQLKKLQDDVATVKAKQHDAQKMLQEIEDEEEE
jgi:hypothetical protein